MSLVAATLSCAVCYGGNTQDPLVKGAVAGVIVLGAFIFFVLLMVAIVGVRFGLRSRKQSRAVARRSPTRTPSTAA